MITCVIISIKGNLKIVLIDYLNNVSSTNSKFPDTLRKLHFFLSFAEYRRTVCNILADIASKDNSQKGSQKDTKSQMIIDMIRQNPDVTTTEMTEKIGISRRSITKITNKLQADGVILRVGARKDGMLDIDVPMYSKIERGERRAKREQVV